MLETAPKPADSKATTTADDTLKRKNRDAEAQMGSEPVLVDRLLEVLLQLGLLRVRARPVVRLERVGVEVGADVDLDLHGGTRIEAGPGPTRR